jgi:hypothetical protein
VFTARYGLIPYIKQNTFSLYDLNTSQTNTIVDTLIILVYNLEASSVLFTNDLMAMKCSEMRNHIT